ncbi:putative 6-phosphogluconolactonase-like protein 4 [Colletotrichum chlorophyti]|uniref:Putative 6-phosphogluconolactonase-like protein 4 n=1 Tax=Colletotrichum chlorophyti TaxID=708187 RepID=A0A1Q8RMS9_9PEZI|nr:putative 6-phosphogluconolactonase-like protein 4 [Colletotrichum chlorophyti]
MRFTSVVLSAAAASAAAIARQESPALSAKVLIGSPGSIAVVDYNGKEFKTVANDTRAGTSPSWMVFKEPNLIYAVDENSNDTRLFNFDPVTNELKFVQNATGSGGVVSLEFNSDKTRLVGTSFGQGTIDVWDISDGASLKLIKTLQSEGTLGPNKVRQDKSRAHQAILDPSGRFFAVTDLGTDSILIIDSKDDAFTISNRVLVPSPGCGPRHGAWYPAKAAQATHYILACELTNNLEVFKVSANGSSLAFTRTQELSTYGAAFPPANATSAAAGEVVVSADGKDVYVSNRLSGNDTDSISHFRIKQAAATAGSSCKNATAADIELEFVEAVSSGGQIPRMFSLSRDDKTLFSTNQQGELGLVAFNRVEGKLIATPAASLPASLFGPLGFGPQFVQQIA